MTGQVTTSSVGSRQAGAGVLVATCLSTLLVNANTSAVSILLPAISRDIGSPVTTLQWAVTAYSLVGAAVIVTAGALGDVFGRRRIFLGGLALFIGSCVLIALSTGEVGIIGGRAIQGAAGSTILACGLSLLTVATEGAGRLRAVAIWGAASAVGAAAGPLIGGVLVDTAGWEGLFWLDAALMAVCVPATLAGVAESRDPSRPRSIDLGGAVLVAAILVPFVLGVSQGSAWGWLSIGTLSCFAATIVATFAFVAVEQRVAVPLVDLRLLRNRVLVGSTLAILIGAATINGLMFVVSIYFQDPATLALSPLQAGLATLPATVGLVAVTPLIARLTTRMGMRRVIGAGFVITTGGFAVLVFVQAGWGYAAFVLPLIAVAVGMGLSNSPASSAATSSVKADQVGAASGISNMARYVGAAVATAAVASVYAAVSTDRLAAGAPAGEALATALSRAALLLTICSAAGIALAWFASRRRPPPPTGEDYGASAAAHSHTVPTRTGARHH